TRWSRRPRSRSPTWSTSPTRGTRAWPSAWPRRCGPTPPGSRLPADELLQLARDVLQLGRGDAAWRPPPDQLLDPAHLLERRGVLPALVEGDAELPARVDLVG